MTVSDVWTTCIVVTFRVKVSCTSNTLVDGIKHALVTVEMPVTINNSLIHFHLGDHFPPIFNGITPGFKPFTARAADDYLTVQNQAVAMGTSFGEVILNRSNLKKQDVSIISDLRQESIGNLGKCEREKKRQV